MNETDDAERVARLVIYPLALTVRILDAYLVRTPARSEVGRATVAAIHAFESAERTARAAIPFDPTGL